MIHALKNENQQRNPLSVHPVCVASVRGVAALTPRPRALLSTYRAVRRIIGALQSEPFFVFSRNTTYVSKCCSVPNDSLRI